MDSPPRAESIRPSVALVERIAELEGADPLELDPPLHDVVDSDALDDLCASSPADLAVSFEYRGYLVRVESDGTVDVRGEPAAEVHSGESAGRSLRAFSD
ncbi:HalOD1 output domain-containing protein [Halomarina pelagica]|uniref:HalOD1 output domain-containing protein n=1 Tax=Halomarina pelagica TaxID=2961599 RepID=UPI0020C3F666|nr:HalOD1 output domain-containing protein [Halomarina sp. BND7]